MKSFFYILGLFILASCGGGSSNSNSNANNNTPTIPPITKAPVWTMPNSSDGFLMQASSFTTLSSLNNYMPSSSEVYAKWNPQSGALTPGIKFMMFGTPTSLCPSGVQGDLLPFDDSELTQLGINPSTVLNELRFEPQPFALSSPICFDSSGASMGSQVIHGPNFTFLDGQHIWMKTQSTSQTNALLKTYDDKGQNGTGANSNIIGNFISFRFPFSYPQPPDSIKPFAKNNVARISLSTSIKSIDSGNSTGITQPKQQVMATLANPDCYSKKLSVCQINILLDVAIARKGVSNWNSQTWILYSNVSLDSAQGNLPIWESFLPANGQSSYFKDIAQIAITSRGSPTLHTNFDNQVFNAEISFDSFKTALRLASAQILNKPISTDTTCGDCQTVFGQYWNDVNHWILLDTSIGQEVFDDSHNNGIIVGETNWLFVGASPD